MSLSNIGFGPPMIEKQRSPTESARDHGPLTVLVTGANGFIGHHMCIALGRAGYRIRRAVRACGAMDKLPHENWIETGDVGPMTDWTEALHGVQAVVHLAAHVHRLDSNSASVEEYFRVNAEGTEALALQACAAGVQRFVFLSSAKIHGETTDERPFKAEDTPAPTDAYGESKLAAETALCRIADHTQMQWVIVRPPLVYGPGVGANFYRLLTLVDRQVPLPIKRIRNMRSLVSIGNLCDFLLHVLRHHNAASRAFLVSDDNDLSTSELVRKIATSIGKRPLLFSLPLSIFAAAGKILGFDAEVLRLTKSMQLDISQTRSVLGWQPSENVDDALSIVADWYLSRETRSR
jgi:nucleoside-diphosphate-sugar epimerase